MNDLTADVSCEVRAAARLRFAPEVDALMRRPMRLSVLGSASRRLGFCAPQFTFLRPADNGIEPRRLRICTSQIWDLHLADTPNERCSRDGCVSQVQVMHGSSGAMHPAFRLHAPRNSASCVVRIVTLRASIGASARRRCDFCEAHCAVLRGAAL